MGLVGFDPELVATSIKNVQSAYDDLIRAIEADMQSQFVNGMQDKWACADAQKFFQSFKEVMDTLIKDSNNTFQSVVEAMNSAANGWAQQTGGSWAPKAFNRLDKQIDVSGIRENIGGVRGVDPEATSVSGRLASISGSAIGALAASITCIFTDNVAIQAAVFVVTSLIMILFMKPLAKKLFKTKDVPMNNKTVIGKNGIVTQTIDNINSKGQVKVAGELWSAISKEDDEIIEKGATVLIEDINGVKLIVKKV